MVWLQDTQFVDERLEVVDLVELKDEELVEVELEGVEFEP